MVVVAGDGVKQFFIGVLARKDKSVTKSSRIYVRLETFGK